MLIRVSPQWGVYTEHIRDDLYRKALEAGFTILYEQKKLEDHLIPLKLPKLKHRKQEHD